MKSYKYISCAALVAISLVMTACEKAPSDSVPVPDATEALTLSGTSVFGNKGQLIKSSPGMDVSVENNIATLGSTEVKLTAGGKTGGAYITVPKVLEAEAQGKTIKVHFLAKADPSNPSMEFAAAYSTSMNGNSGWRTFSPTSEYAPYSFQYRVPPASAAGNLDYIGINADTSGSGKKILLKSVSVEIVK